MSLNCSSVNVAKKKKEKKRKTTFILLFHIRSQYTRNNFLCRVHVSGTQRTFNKEIVNLLFWRAYRFMVNCQNK